MFPKVYSATELLIDYPPNGYQFIIPEQKLKTGFLRAMHDSKIIKFLYKSLFKKIFNTSNLYSKACSVPYPKDADLIIPAHIESDIPVPWILIIVDHPAGLVGYDYNRFMKNLGGIEKKLLSPLCKGIIVFNEVSYEKMKKLFSKEVLKKTVLIRAAVKSQSFKKIYSKKEVLITFIGSTGNPDDFYIKGGLEAMESFKRVSKEFPNIKMIVRCKIPAEVKEKYSDVENLQILQKPLNQEEWFNILKKTDICLNPGHVYPLMASLESLSFGIPVIMLDSWGVRDYLTDGKNSILIKPSENIKGYNEEEYPLNVKSPNFIKSIKEMDERVINDISDALRKLIKNPKLRERLGKNGKKTAETKFSIKIRNEKLKKFLDNITKSKRRCATSP